MDASANAITVNDLATKKPVVVKVSAQSQVTKLTPAAAQGIAARAKAAAGRGGAPGDLQQVVSQMPPATLANFAKGEAVMVVSTEGTAAGGVTAIMLVGRVEPILTTRARRRAADPGAMESGRWRDRPVSLFRGLFELFEGYSHLAKAFVHAREYGFRELEPVARNQLR